MNSTETMVKDEPGKWVVTQLVSSGDVDVQRLDSPHVNYHAVQSLSPYEYADYLASLNID